MTFKNTFPALGALFFIFMISCNNGTQNNQAGAVASTDSMNATDSMEKGLVSGRQTEPVQILFPKGGETFIKGKDYRIKWTGGDTAITLFLIDSSLQSEGASVSISDRKYGIKNTGSYEYTFPERLPEGTYKFSIGPTSSPYFKVVSK